MLIISQHEVAAISPSISISGRVSVPDPRPRNASLVLALDRSGGGDTAGVVVRKALVDDRGAIVALGEVGRGVAVLVVAAPFEIVGQRSYLSRATPGSPVFFFVVSFPRKAKSRGKAGQAAPNAEETVIRIGRQKKKNRYTFFPIFSQQTR